MIAWTLVGVLWLLGGGVAVAVVREDGYLLWYVRLAVLVCWPPIAAAGLVVGFWKMVRRCVSS